MFIHGIREKTRLRRRAVLLLCGLVACLGMSAMVAATTNLPATLVFLDATGVLSDFHSTGPTDLDNPFFQSLGTNGRSCVSCHQPSDAWTVTPAHIQMRFFTNHSPRGSISFGGCPCYRHSNVKINSFRRF